MGCPKSLGEALDGCGWLGLISILLGVVTVLTVVIGLAIDEITYREISTDPETSIKCGWSTATWCNEPFQMAKIEASGIDTDCVNSMNCTTCT